MVDCRPSGPSKGARCGLLHRAPWPGLSPNHDLLSRLPALWLECRFAVEAQFRAMSCHRDIREMAIHRRTAEGEAAIHRASLRLVDGDGVAVVERSVRAEIEDDGPFLSVEIDRKRLVRHRPDRAEHAVSDPDERVIPREEDAIADGEGSGAMVRVYDDIILKGASGGTTGADRLIEREDVPTAMRQR